jgi:hypothetical protein
LNPTNASDSALYCVSSTAQSGLVTLSGANYAALWNGPSNSFINLTPANASNGIVNAMYGTSQGGAVTIGDANRAILWNGSAKSYKDLTPGTADNAGINAVKGNQQGGYVDYTDPTTGDTFSDAVIWSGSASSMVDMAPTSHPYYSYVNDLCGGQQAGVVNYDYYNDHATLWYGSAASVVDLQPANAVYSAATAITTNQQFGYANFSGQNHAAAWNGSADSCLDLNPIDASNSVIWAADLNQEVGCAQFGANNHAVMWFGTNGGSVDLHNILPGYFTESYAFGVSVNTNETSIVGYAAILGQTESDHAILWKVPPTDLVASALYWDYSSGGAAFQYTVNYRPLRANTVANVYWASGPDVSDIITTAPVYACPIPAGTFGAGNYINISPNFLAAQPTNALYLTLALDSINAIWEPNKTNNFLSIPINRLYATDYTNWIDSFTPPQTGRAPTDCPADDGTPNLIKFALGLDPLTAVTTNIFTPQVQSVGDQNCFCLVMNIAAAAQGVHLGLIYSYDLNSWFPADTTLLGSGSSTQLLQNVRLVVNSSADTNQCVYYRLVASYDPGNVSLTTDLATNAVTVSTSTNGGTYTVQNGGQLNGMTMTVPPGAFAGPQSITVGYSPINAVNSSLPVAPCTPLIHIDAGGSVAGSPITLNLPVTISTNEFAMAFIYHHEDGSLEGLPLLSESTNMLTISTRHFCDVVALKMPIAKLLSLASGSVFSKFWPSANDFEFTNLKLYDNADGICNGMAAFELWYFDNQKNTSGQLNGRFNNYPYDFLDTQIQYGANSVSSMRLCSALKTQKGIITSGTALTTGTVDMFTANPNSLAYYSFYLSLLLTHKPQAVGLLGASGGHMMVVYGASPNSLFIADPNFPGDTTRSIYYPGSETINYTSGTSTYTNMFYCGQTALRDDNIISSLYSDFLAEPSYVDFIGYPLISIHLQEFWKGAWREATNVNALLKSNPVLICHTNAIRLQLGTFSSTVPDFAWKTYDTDGNVLSRMTNAFTVDDGTNECGICSMATAGNVSNCLVDFDWVQIVKKPAPYAPVISSIDQLTTNYCNPLDTTDCQLGTSNYLVNFDQEQGAYYYIVEATTSDWSHLYYSNSFPAAANIVLPNLAGGTIYYVRMSAADDLSVSDFGEVYYFKTATNTVAAPCDMVGQTVDFQYAFTWGQGDPAVHYPPDGKTHTIQFVSTDTMYSDGTLFSSSDNWSLSVDSCGSDVTYSAGWVTATTFWDLTFTNATSGIITTECVPVSAGGGSGGQGNFWIQ